jgi:hypothetical protein
MVQEADDGGLFGEGWESNAALAYFSPLTFSIVEEIAITSKNPAKAWVLVNMNTYLGKTAEAGTNRTRYPA